MIDFLVLGTAKAGTTSLYDLLDRHPATCMSQPKETWYFDGEVTDFSIETYRERHFPKRAQGKRLGEVATSYLYCPHVARRIASALPNARLIAVLRDPIARAYSDWWMMHTRGFDPLSFDEAIENNLERLDKGRDLSSAADWADHLADIRKNGALRYRTYVDYGFYGTQLRRYEDARRDGRLMILQFEKMKRDGLSYLEKVFEFLDLSIPQPDVLLEAIAEPKNEALPSRSIGQLVEFSHRVGISERVPNNVKQVIKRWLSGRREAPAISQQTRSRLINMYASQWNELRSYQELELSLWPSFQHMNRPSIDS